MGLSVRADKGSAQVAEVNPDNILQRFRNAMERTTQNFRTSAPNPSSCYNVSNLLVAISTRLYVSTFVLRNTLLHNRSTMLARQGPSLLGRSLRPATHAAAPCTQARHVHFALRLRPELEEGATPFLSKEAIQVAGSQWQQGLLNRLNDEVRNTDLETLSVARTVLQTAQDRYKAQTFNFASLALNNSFFFSNLVCLACFWLSCVSAAVLADQLLFVGYSVRNPEWQMRVARHPMT